MKKKIRSSFLFIILFLLVVIVTYLPVYFKSSRAGPDTFYTRIHGPILQDYYLDLSTIRGGRMNLMEINRYSTDDNSVYIIHYYLIFLGALGKTTGISDINMYYIGIYIALFIFLLFSFKLINFIVPDNLRKLAILIIFLAGPLPAGQIRLLGRNIWFGEGWWTFMNPYLRIFYRPHHFLGVAMLVVSSYYFLKFIKSKSVRDVIFCSVASVIGILSSFTPILIFLSAVLIVSILKLIRRDFSYIGKTALIFIICLPAIMLVNYQLKNSFNGLVISKMELAYNTGETFPTTYWVLFNSYGFLLPFIFAAIFQWFRRATVSQLFILIMTLLPSVYYFLAIKGIIPVAKMRFAYSAPYLFGGLLSILVIDRLLEKTANARKRRLIYTLIFTVFSINSLMSWKYYWLPELSRYDNYSNIYISRDYLEVFSYIDKNISPLSSILAKFHTGMFIPVFTDLKTYVGHETSTINFQSKAWASAAFLSAALSFEEAQKLIKDNEISYVLWDSDTPPEKYDRILEKIFQRGKVILYKSRI